MRVPRYPERWLAAIALAIVLALLAARWQRQQSIPAPLRHVPLDAEAFAVTAPLGSMWRGLEPHLAPFFEAAPSGPRPQGSALSDAARELDSELRKKNIVLRHPEDLAGLGIDGRGGAAVALVRGAQSQHLLWVLPLIDRAAFIAAAERYLGARAAPGDAPFEHLQRIGKSWVGYGDGGLALWCDDPAVLDNALRDSAQRLAYWRSNDRIGRAFAAPLPGTAGPAKAWLRGRLRLPELLPPGGEMHVALAVDPATLGIDAHMPLSPARSNFVAGLMHAEPPRAADSVLARSDLALVLGSEALPALLREASAVLLSAGYAPFGGRFAPVLAEVSSSEGVRRLHVALSDSSKRVPGVVMGLQMSATDADALVLRLQTSLRVARDNEILRSAARRHREQHPDAAAPAVAELLDGGQIAADRGGLWARYRWQDDMAVPNPPLAAQDFAGNDYTAKSGEGMRLRYLMPPFTANDLEHRFAERREELQVDRLVADEYRLCSVYHDGTLWIGNDAAVVGEWLARLAGEALANPLAEVAALDSRAADAKALMLLQPSRLRDAGQLYPDDEINQLSRQALADLDAYRAVLLDVAADPQAKELHVRARLVRH